MCYLVRISGGIGFYDMYYAEARQAANELGSIKEVICRYHDGSICSVSFFNANNKEVFLYHPVLSAGQVFDPPRTVADFFLSDYRLGD